MNLDSVRIKILMAEQGLSQTALSKKCGISAQNISTIIRRGTCAPLTAGKLARGLDVPVADILKEV